MDTENKEMKTRRSHRCSSSVDVVYTLSSLYLVVEVYSSYHNLSHRLYETGYLTSPHSNVCSNLLQRS